MKSVNENKGKRSDKKINFGENYFLIIVLVLSFGMTSVYGQVNLSDMSPTSTDSLKKTRFATSPREGEERTEYGIFPRNLVLRVLRR